jgi:hypothetical protein
MNEDEILGFDKNEDEGSLLPDSEEDTSAIYKSPVADFIEDFERNSSGDPFRLTQKYAREGVDIIADVNNNSSGLSGISTESQSLFNHLSKRLINSAPVINKRNEKVNNFISDTLSTRLLNPGERTESGIQPGFVGRAGTKEYLNLINQPGEFKGVFFQFQQESVVSQLIQRKDSWQLTTQRLAFSPNASKDEKTTTAQILAGNEVTISAGNLLNKSANPVTAVKAYGSFHPKVGYVGDTKKGFTAFLGTQNITPALANNNSIETLMVFNRPGTNNLVANKVESAVANEIFSLTNTISNESAQQNDYTYLPGSLRKSLANKGESRNFLYVESEIYSRLSGVLSNAANNKSSVKNKDQVVISMGEISILLKTRGYAQDLIASLTKLAREKRLLIVTDSNKMANFFDDLRTTKLNDPTKAIGINEEFIKLLIDSGSIQAAPTGYQHDKSIAIFGGKTKNLLFLNVGSANLSADSLIPVGKVNNHNDYFQNNLDVLKRTHTDYDLDSPINLDVNLAIGFGRYTDKSRSNKQINIKQEHIREYLQKVDKDSKLVSHYDSLAGGKLLSKLDNKQPLFNSGFISEKNSDSKKVEELRRQIENLNKELGGDVIKVQGRYNLNELTDTLAKQTGIKVVIKGLYSDASVTLNLTVNKQGNIIIADNNKVINGSIFINNSSDIKTISGKSIAPGRSTKLTGAETTLGLISTIAREVSYQSRYALVNQVYNRLSATNPDIAMKASRQIIADSISEVVPEIGKAIKPGQGKVNLASVMKSLQKNGSSIGVETENVIQQARLALAAGMTSPTKKFNDIINPEIIQKRNTLLNSVFNELLQEYPGGVQLAERLAGSKLNQTLMQDTDGLLNDIKLSVILSTNEGRNAFNKATSTLNSRLINDITAPFLAAHELGYSAMQGEARLPIYAESTIYDDNTIYGKILNAGILNPAEVKPSTRIGKPGEYYSPIGASSYAKPLKLPAFGGLRQLNVINSDISTGATIAYDNDMQFRSIAGLAKVSKDDYLRQIKLLGGANPEDLIEQEFKYDYLYLLPFNKGEQVPQRVKNIVGTRPAIDINKSFINSIRTLSLNVNNISATNIISGRLKESLPDIQYSAFLEKVKELGSKQAAEDYYRNELLIDPNNTKGGFIGPAKMRRVAISGGASLIGDSSYINEDYDLSVGDVTRLNIKFNSKQIINQLNTLTIISKYLAKGNIVLSTPVLLPDQSLITQTIETIKQSGKTLTEGLIKEYISQVNSDYLVKGSSEGFKLYQKEGLYSNEEGQYKRIGKFDNNGLIVVEGTGTTVETIWGTRSQPITLKFPAFGKRYQEGVSVILDTPYIENNIGGMMNISTNVLTTWEPGSGSRVAGSGAVKSPFTVIQSDIFNKIEAQFNVRDNLLRPANIKNDKVFGIFGFGHFKGFNYDTGLFLLSQQDTKASLLNLSGEDLARSLSILFMGNKQVKSALKQSLLTEGLTLAASAIDNIKATDFGLTKEGKPTTELGKVALGLTSLAMGEHASKDIAKGSLESLRETVVLALSGSTEAQSHLKQQTNKLLQIVVDDPRSFSAGVFNESSLVARGAGLLTHMSFISQQIFRQHEIGRRSVGTLYELDFSNTDRYLNDVSYRNRVDAVAATAGLIMPPATENNKDAISKKLSLIQSKFKNEFVLEELKDITVSKSLVPTGNKDEVALEYQYMVGMTNKYLKAFTTVGGGSEASAEIQRAFSMLVGVTKLGLPDPNAFIEYRIAFPGQEPGFIKQQHLNAQKLLLGYTSLADSLGFLDAAVDGVADPSNTDGLERFLQVQQIATATVGLNDPALESRAIALNISHKLKYFSDSSAQIKQLNTLSEQLGYKPLNADTSFGLVSEVITNAYQGFIQDRQIRRVNNEGFIGFSEYVKSKQAGDAAYSLEQEYELISELTKGTDRLIGVPLKDDIELINSKVQQQLLKINERSLTKVSDTFNSNIYKDFVTGATALENRLITSGNTELLTEIQKTKQVVMPQVSTQLITTGSDEGQYRTAILDPQVYTPSVGVLLGTDVLKQASLLFPQHVDEALKYQLDLRNKLIETEELRGKLFNNPDGTISEAEKLQLESFQDTLDNSRLGLLKLLDTDLVRKALGDRQHYRGGVGIAVGSFALDAGQTVLGNRYRAVFEGRQVGQVLENQFKILESASFGSQEEFNKVVNNTKQLFRTLDLRGAVNNEESNRTNIASKQQINTLLTQVRRAKFEDMPTQDLIKELEVNVLSAAANINKNRVKDLQSKDKNELHKLISMSTGSIRRGGAPAGSAALTANQNFYEVSDIHTFQETLHREGSGLVPTADRFKTGMIAPAIGRLLTMLGDYDGDAYQFLATGVGDQAGKIVSTQKENIKISAQIRKLENQFSRLNKSDSEDINNLVQISETSERIELLNQELSTNQERLGKEINKLNQYSAKYSRLEQKALKDVREWVGSYTALPDFIVNNKSISTGTLMSMVQQLSGTMPQIEEASDRFKATEQRLDLIRSLFNDGFKFSQDSIDLNKINDYTNHLLPEADQDTRDNLRFDLQGIFKESKAQNISTLEDFNTVAQDYLSFKSNLGMTIEQVNKSVKKASGLALNPMDFEGLQSLIGQAGTELIGKTYNTLIPLLDSTMAEHSLLTAMKTTGKESFSNVINERLETLKIKSPEQSLLIEGLQQKLSSQDTSKAIKDKFAGVTGTLASLQQLIRDSLKEKSDKGIVGLLRETSYQDGMTLPEAMDAAESDAERLQLLKSKVQTRLGNDLTFQDNPGVTGFGALLKLAEFSNTKDDDIYQKFIQEPGLEQDYANKLGKTVKSPLDYASGQVLNLLEKTQASFIASTFTGEAKNIYLGQLQSFKEDSKYEELSDKNKLIYQTVEKYEQDKLTIGEGALEGLENRLIKDVSLIEVQNRNKENSILTIESLKGLRKSYLNTQTVRYGDGDIYERMASAGVDSQNAYLRMLQRGQQPDMTDALYMSGYKIDAISRNLNEAGYDVNNLGTTDQMRVAQLMGLNSGEGIFNKDEQRLLTEALLTRDNQGVSGLDSLRKSSAAMTQGVFGLLNQMESLHNMPQQQEVISSQLAGLYEDGSLNVDKVQRLGLITSTEESRQVIQNVESQLAEKITQPFGRNAEEVVNKTKAGRNIFYNDPGVGVAGALAGPLLLLAASSSGVKLDEKFGMFAFDAAQALATVNTDPNRLTSELIGDASAEASKNFRIGRIKQDVQTEGLVVGAAQSLLKETLFNTANQLIFKGIDKISGRVPGGQTKVAAGIATVGAEILGTVFALGVSRTLSKQRTQQDEFITDRMTDLLKSFSEQIWKLVEQAQLAANDPSIEIVDTDENQRLDFELSAVPSELERDVESGIIIIEETGAVLDTEFDNSSQQQASLSSGI